MFGRKFEKTDQELKTFTEAADKLMDALAPSIPIFLLSNAAWTRFIPGPVRNYYNMLLHARTMMFDDFLRPMLEKQRVDNVYLLCIIFITHEQIYA